MSARSAYNVLDKPGADEFARAWDQALGHGMDRLKFASLSRAMDGGDFVPIYRRGKLVRIEHRTNDRLAVALLSGREKDVDDYRRGAQTRWRQKREWAALDATYAAEAEAEARAREEHVRQIEEFLKRRPRPGPRVRAL